MSQGVMTDAAGEGVPGPVAPAMGRTVRRGMLWQVMNTGVTRVLGVVAQVVLAVILSQDDFALFAIAISFSIITQVLQDGGMRQILIQRIKEYDRLAGSVFWLALAINTLAAGVLIALAPVAARMYGSDALLPMLVIIGVAVPLGTPASIYYARLFGDLRYRSVASIQASAAVLRYTLAVALAYCGMGPLSFVIALPAVAVLESVLGFICTRDQPWRRGPNPALWPGLLSKSVWLLFGTGASALMNVGAYMFLALVLEDRTVVGVYFFAYQLVAQTAFMLAFTLQSVLFPALSRLREEPERFRDGVVRSTRLMVLAAAPVSLGLGVLYPPLEALLWGGKWAEAGDAVLAIGLSSSVYVTLFVASAVQHAMGWFRAWAYMVSALAVGQVGCAVLGAAATGSAGGVAVFVAAHLVLASVVYGYWTFARVGVPAGSYFGAVFPAWAAASAAGGGVLWLRGVLPEAWPPAAELLVLGLTYGVLFLAGARALIPGHLAEMASLLPAPVARAVPRFVTGGGARGGGARQR